MRRRYHTNFSGAVVSVDGRPVDYVVPTDLQPAPRTRGKASRLNPRPDPQGEGGSSTLDGNTFARERVCGLCGGEVGGPGGGRPRKYHPECRRVVNDLARLRRDLAAFAVLEAEFARALVGRCLAVVNLIPRKFHAARDARGRFA